MRRVQQANQSPFRCAVIPYKGNSNARGGFIDTGQHLRDEKVYICMEAAMLIAQEIGWSPPSHVRGLEAEGMAKQARIDQLEAELADEKQINNSIEFLGTKDFIARQKRGPKKKEHSKEPDTAKAA